MSAEHLTNTDLHIAGLHVRVSCMAEACVAGIRALTALFEMYKGGGSPALHFRLETSSRAIQLTCNGEYIWQGEEPGEVVAAFEWAFYNRTIDRLYPRLISLHAASVKWYGHGITIAGRSGAGKSSLCTAALLDGASYFSDEYSLLGTAGLITPFPRPLQWGGESHPAFSLQAMRDSGLFGEARYSFTDRDNQAVTSLLWHPAKLAGKEKEMELLLMPRFDAAAQDVQCEALPRSQALMELAAEMHHKLPVAERLRELHRRIPQHLRIHRLIFSDVHRAWGTVKALLAGD